MHQNKNPQQSPWQRRRQQRRQQDEQLATERKQALDASAPRLRNLFIFVQVFLLYVVVSIFGVDDRDLLDPNSTVKVPLLNIGLPTFYFFLLAPVLVALLHINLILHHQAYQDKLRHWRDGAPKAQLDQLAPNFFDIAFLAQDRWQRQLVRASLWFLLYFWPPAALCLALFWFADYQNPWVTLGHFGLLIISYGASIYFAQRRNRVNNKLHSFWRWMQSSLLVALPLLGIYLFSLVILLTWVSYEHSNQWFENNLLYQPKIDAPSFIYQDLDTSTIHLASAYEINATDKELTQRYSQPLDLSDRSLRYANLSSSFLPKVKLRSADLSGVDLTEARLQGAKLNNALLQSAKLNNARLQGAELNNARLQGAELNNARLQGAELNNARLQGAELNDAHLQGVKLNNAHLQSAGLNNARLQGASLWRALLRDTNLIEAQLQGAYLREAHLQGAYLREANLQGASLTEARLRDADLREANLQGAKLGRARLQGTNLREANLQAAYLREAHLQAADLREANLQGAVLARARLQGAHLRGALLQAAYLRGARLQGAHLRGARLQAAYLQEARLQGADLTEARLQGADLTEAHLQGAYLREALLQGTDLTDAQLHGAWSDFDTVSDLNWTGNAREELLLLEGFISDLSSVNGQALSSSEVVFIIYEFDEIKKSDVIFFDYLIHSINAAISRIRAAIGKPWTLEGSGAITGELT